MGKNARIKRERRIKRAVERMKVSKAKIRQEGIERCIVKQ
jgi:hypothetical protein